MSDAERLLTRGHASPHSYLGAHAGDGGVRVRVFRPAAAGVRGLGPLALLRAAYEAVSSRRPIPATGIPTQSGRLLSSYRSS